MNQELLGALIGFMGALLGAGIGAIATNNYMRRSARTSLSLQLLGDYHSLLPDRIRADDILHAARKTLPAKKAAGYNTLYEAIGDADWPSVSRVRHFWGEVALLESNHLLDSKLAGALLAEDLQYWRDIHFTAVEDVFPPASKNWEETWSRLNHWVS